jgi:hypothetical protein
MGTGFGNALDRTGSIQMERSLVHRSGSRMQRYDQIAEVS